MVARQPTSHLPGGGQCCGRAGLTTGVSCWERSEGGSVSGGGFGGQGEATLSVMPDGDAERLLHLSLIEARAALYEPNTSPAVTTAIWQQALNAALAEREPSDLNRLTFIWLAIPQLTGTVYRICSRLRADRTDVESEMVLALLDGLRIADPTASLTAQALMTTARSSAWRFARHGLEETATDRLENVPEANSQASTDDLAEGRDRQRNLEVEVVRPDGTDGLHAPLRFRVSAEHLRKALFDDVGRRVATQDPARAGSKKRISTLSLRNRSRHR